MSALAILTECPLANCPLANCRLTKCPLANCLDTEITGRAIIFIFFVGVQKVGVGGSPMPAGSLSES